MNDLMVLFNESLSFDKVLHEAEIRGSITIAKAMRQLELLTEQQLGENTTGLYQVDK